MQQQKRVAVRCSPLVPSVRRPQISRCAAGHVTRSAFPLYIYNKKKKRNKKREKRTSGGGKKKKMYTRRVRYYRRGRIAGALEKKYFPWEKIGSRGVCAVRRFTLEDDEARGGGTTGVGRFTEGKGTVRRCMIKGGNELALSR